MTDGSAISVWELTGGVHAPAAARKAVRDTLGHLVSEDLLDTIVLLTSEIVSNAVIRDVESAVVLTVEVSTGTIVVTLADGHADAPALKGLGRALVDKLDLGWGAHVHRAGKAVWFSIQVAEDRCGVGGGAGAGTVPS